MQIKLIPPINKADLLGAIAGLAFMMVVMGVVGFMNGQSIADCMKTGRSHAQCIELMKP